MKKSPLVRKKAVKRVNAKRKAKRAAEDRVYGSFFRYVRTLPCAIAGEHECGGTVDGHHIKSVGAGGEDANNCVPLCRFAHTEIHMIGAARFNDKYFNDLHLYARAIYQRWQDGFDL